MTDHLAEIPLWAAIPAAVFILIGGGLALIGTIGLVRLKSFYDRIHAPTLGTSWGTAGMILASILVFTVAGGRPVVHEFVIGVFVMITMPVTLMLLARAALYRDRTEGNTSEGIPGVKPRTETPDDGSGEGGGNDGGGIERDTGAVAEQQRE